VEKGVGLRNILIHNYSGVELEIVWDIIKNRLDSLLEAKVRQAFNEEEVHYEGIVLQEIWKNNQL